MAEIQTLVYSKVKYNLVTLTQITFKDAAVDLHHFLVLRLKKRDGDKTSPATSDDGATIGQYFSELIDEAPYTATQNIKVDIREHGLTSDESTIYVDVYMFILIPHTNPELIEYKDELKALFSELPGDDDYTTRPTAYFESIGVELPISKTVPNFDKNNIVYIQKLTIIEQDVPDLLEGINTGDEVDSIVQIDPLSFSCPEGSPCGGVQAVQTLELTGNLGRHVHLNTRYDWQVSVLNADGDLDRLLHQSTQVDPSSWLSDGTLTLSLRPPEENSHLNDVSYLMTTVQYQLNGQAPDVAEYGTGVHVVWNSPMPVGEGVLSLSIVDPDADPGADHPAGKLTIGAGMPGPHLRDPNHSKWKLWVVDKNGGETRYDGSDNDIRKEWISDTNTLTLKVGCGHDSDYMRSQLDQLRDDAARVIKMESNLSEVGSPYSTDHMACPRSGFDWQHTFYNIHFGANYEYILDDED